MGELYHLKIQGHAGLVNLADENGKQVNTRKQLEDLLSRIEEHQDSLDRVSRADIDKVLEG